MPPAEVALWNQIRRRQLNGFKFRRQYGVGPYVIDFFCPKVKLSIEIDGDSHYQPDKEAYELKRQEYIKSFGIELIRFTNQEVYESLAGVVGRISDVLDEKSD